MKIIKEIGLMMEVELKTKKRPSIFFTIEGLFSIVNDANSKF